MVWKYQQGDNIPLATLREYEKFFKQDLQEAIDYLERVKRYFRHRAIINSKFNPLKIAEEDVQVSKKNLEVVAEAIKHAIKNKL